MIIKNKYLKAILSISLFALSLNAYAVNYHNVNVVGELTTVFNTEEVPVIVKDKIDNMAKDYVKDDNYKSVLNKAKTIIPKKEMFCNEDDCVSYNVQKISNFEMGSIEKGFVAMANSDGIDEEKAKNNLFNLIEKINNYDNHENDKYVLLLNTISSMDRQGDDQFLSLVYDCKKNNDLKHKIIDCMLEKSATYKNVFLNIKVKCFGYVYENYTTEGDWANKFDLCINEEMENIYDWIGYQFFSLGSLLYYLQK